MILDSLQIKTACQGFAISYDVDINLVDAICKIESNRNAFAMRYEPNFKYIYQNPPYTNVYNNITEKLLQKCSIGLMQIMGATARWMEFKDPLTYLFHPENNLFIGMKYIRYLMSRYSDIDDIISSYNAGSAIKLESGKYINQQYVDKVKEQYVTIISSCK